MLVPSSGPTARHSRSVIRHRPESKANERPNGPRLSRKKALRRQSLRVDALYRSSFKPQITPVHRTRKQWRPSTVVSKSNQKSRLKFLRSYSIQFHQTVYQPNTPDKIRQFKVLMVNILRTYAELALCKPSLKPNATKSVSKYKTYFKSYLKGLLHIKAFTTKRKRTDFEKHLFSFTEGSVFKYLQLLNGAVKAAKSGQINATLTHKLTQAIQKGEQDAYSKRQ